MPALPRDELHRTIDAVWRLESAKIVAGVARIVRDVGLAEELAQDALVAALEHWPKDGLPDKPAAWLMQTAKNRALDRVRQDALHRNKHAELAADADARGDHLVDGVEAAAMNADDIGDDLLRLIFVACHPLLSKEAQVALTLKLVGGLATPEIARAFLVPEPTIAQRIVRAKRTLAEARVPFEVPQADERSARLAAVLEVIYLIFNEGYSATSGEDLIRPTLCEEALRLARILAQLAPAESEVHGLAALLEIQASRLRARVDGEGRPILLLDQDRGRWDRLLIGRGLASLAQARRLGGEAGPYQLQAAIAACHAGAPTAEATDWRAIAALYAVLAQRLPSPVVELNRAVAVGIADGPAAALAIVEALIAQGALERYHLLYAVQGDLLAKLGQRDLARAALERAAALAGNARERTLLNERAAQL